MVSGALETQWALASGPFNTVNQTGNVSNIMSYAGSQPTSTPVENQQMDKAAKAQLKAQEKAMKEQAKAQKEAMKVQAKAMKEAAKARKAAACSGGTCSTCS